MKKIQSILGMICIGILLGGTLAAQSITGQWRTIDDETNKQKSIVEIFIRGGKMYGKILKTWDDDGITPTNKLCEECKDELFNKPIIGMEIIDGLERDGDIWKGKKGILDPENGKWYNVKIWLEEKDQLTVRGSIGPIGRKQTWHRVK